MLYLYTENFLWQGRAKSLAKELLGRGGRGPEAVVGSLERGLKKLHEDFAVNQKISKPIGVACVLNGAKVLQKLLQLKQAGMIKKLIAGPNLMLSPKDYGGLLARPEIDAVLTPSEQIRINYGIISPEIKNKTKAWFAGVDEDYWHPDADAGKNSVLVYHKTKDLNFSNSVKNTISKFGWDLTDIWYGKYTREEYRACLAKSCFAVFISEAESQGIALAEAWAMDVPTIVWNPMYLPHNPTPNLIPNTACPYLNSLNGLDWKDLSELDGILGKMKNIIGGFKPRQWVLNNMTDAHSAKLFLDIANNPVAGR